MALQIVTSLAAASLVVAAAACGGTAPDLSSDGPDGGTKHDAGTGTATPTPGPTSTSTPDPAPTTPVDPPASAPDAGTTPEAQTDYAPYFFTWSWDTASTNDFYSLMNLKKKAGLTGATLAFVLSDGGCAADRGAQDHLSDVKAFVAAGGKLKASFGGASGTYLEYQCTDAASLTKAIEDFVDQTGIKDLDFDIEQDAAFTTAVNDRRATALKKVQDDRGVKLSFTLAANPSYQGSGGGGLTSQGMGLLRAVLSKGATISHVNMMTMDYGDDWASKNMGQIAIGSITDTQAQIKTLIPGITDAAAWAMVGATPMIGKNDDAETFTLANARDLVAFAKQKKIGLVAFWAINRDRVCSDFNECTTVNGQAYDFHNVLKGVQ